MIEMRTHTTFTSHQPVPPGALFALRSQPNPHGAGADAIYLFRGAPAAAPVQRIIVEPELTLPGPPELPSGRPFHLRLLHFNDLHGYLADVSGSDIRPIFSRIAGHIRRVRVGCAGRPDAGVLVFSGGDDLAGTAFTDLMGCRPASFRCHPAFRLYSTAGVDAGAVGNHDLDWGLGMLALSARHDATFPLLSANLLASAGSEPAGIYPAALFVVKGVRVGVIGLTTSAEIKDVLPGEFALVDPITVARNLLPAFRPLCDVLIVLSHLGHSLDDPAAVVAGAGDVELAAGLPHGIVHLIIGGHTHSVLHDRPGGNESGLGVVHCVNGIPIVQAGAQGRYLGEVIVDVTPTGVAVTKARLHHVESLEEDVEFEATHVRSLAAQVRRALREPLGIVATHPDLDRVCVREAFARKESALANFIADALVARCRTAGFPVDFAMVDASSMCDGLPQGGVLTFGDLFRLAPYGDSIVLCRLTSEQVQALLDDNARRAELPGCPGEGREERGFVQFSREVRYRIAGGPIREHMHAVDATINGVSLEQLLSAHTGPFLVACSSFVRQSASRWERRAAEERGAQSDTALHAIFDLHALPVEQTGLALREELVAYAREMGGITEEAGLVCDARVNIMALAHRGN